MFGVAKKATVCNVEQQSLSLDSHQTERQIEQHIAVPYVWKGKKKKAILKHWVIVAFFRLRLDRDRQTGMADGISRSTDGESRTA